MIIGYASGHEPAYPIDTCFLLQGFSYGPHKAQVYTSMGVGMPKVRPRFTFSPWKLEGQIVVTTAQKAQLDAWIKDTLQNGVVPFLMLDPLNDIKRWLWRFNKPLTYTCLAPGYFRTTLSLDRLPDFYLNIPGVDGLVDAYGNHLMDNYKHWLGA